MYKEVPMSRRLSLGVLVIIALALPAASSHARRNPDWPCAMSISSGTAPPSQTKRYTYGGPARCSTLPDLDLVGCPTEEEALQGTTVFRKRTFSYDGKGKLVKVEYTRAGKLTTRLTATWDARGNPVKMEIDNGPDGKVDAVNTYHRKGQAMVVESRHDGKVATIWIYHYDKAGKLLRFDTDRFGDGKVMLKSKRSYKGKRPSLEETAGPSGKILTRTTYDYSCKQ
jgi:hypothetical protein